MDEVKRWLDQHQNQMTDDLVQLCNLNSGSANPDGLNRVARWLDDYFSPLETPTQQITLPEFDTIDDHGNVGSHSTGTAFRWDVATAWYPDKKRILMTIHYDTVYGVDSPFQICEPFELPGPNGSTEKRMRGPGVIDAKGGIIVLRWAALAAKKFLDLSNLDLTIVLTPDEEIGSPASIALWEQIAHQFDFAMLFEPTLPDGSLVSQRKGTGTFTLVVRGRAAHSGRNFPDGRNAILQASRIALVLDSLNGQRPDVTINVGRVRGGDAVNVVPDLCTVRVNVRVTSRSDQNWIEEQIKSVVQQFDRPDEGFRVEVHGGMQAAPKVVDEKTLRWMGRVEQAGAAIGETITWKPSGGASDGNKLTGLGLTNIDTFGPEGDLLHSNQEWIRLSSLPRKAALCVSLLSLSTTA